MMFNIKGSIVILMDTLLNKPIVSVAHSTKCTDRTGLTFILDDDSKQSNQEKTTFQLTALYVTHRFFSPARMVSTKCILVIYN